MASHLTNWASAVSGWLVEDATRGDCRQPRPEGLSRRSMPKVDRGMLIQNGVQMLARAGLALGVAAAVGAQSIRGVVVDRADAPVSGVVVQLVDSASMVTAVSLTNERGEFRLRGNRAGTFRLRTLRIGFRPFTSDGVSLTSGADLQQRLVLANLPMSLDTIRVSGRNSCHAVADSAGATYRVWEQVRTALTAAQMTAGERAALATTVAYERTLDADGRRVISQTRGVSSDYVKQPWRTIDPDALHRNGFVATEQDNSTIYYAPGLDLLLSNGFVEDHCFRLKSDKKRLGIEFEPTSERKRTPEIRGTLWLDRASSELRMLEYRYVNISSEQEDEARGDMDFIRLRSGDWAITRWSIRMPVLENRVRSQSFGGAGTHIVQIKVAGGELALVRRGADTLWSRPPLTLAGTIVDSVSRNGIAHAHIALRGTALESVADDRGRFAIAGVLPGEYVADIHTPSLDSMNAVYRTGLAFADAEVQTQIRVPSGRQIAARPVAARPDSMSAPRGNAELAGAPLAAAPATGVATLTGAVVVDSTQEPVIAAEVTLMGGESPRSTMTDAGGAFRLTNVPAGEYSLIVRRIGFGALDARISLLANQTTNRRVVLTRVVALDSVVVRAKASDMVMREFEENRRLGLGHFLTRDDLANMENQTMSSVLSQLPGVTMISGKGTPGWVATSRFRSGCPGLEMKLLNPPLIKCLQAERLYYLPQGYESMMGIKVACYALVYIDNNLMNRGPPTEPFDVSSMSQRQLEGVEYYSNLSQMPARYQRPGAECGVLVFHTRRSP